MGRGNLRVRDAEAQPKKVGGGEDRIKNAPGQVWCGYLTLMPAYCRSSQLGFVHERWGRTKKEEMIMCSCMSLLHRPKGNVAKVNLILKDRTQSHILTFIQVCIQIIRPLLYFCFCQQSTILE